jgi:ATP-dependent DNA helicase RecG
MKTDMVEDERTEFKGEFTNKAVKAAVAFSNTRGGTIFVGISDDGTVAGVDDIDAAMNAIASSLADNVRPSIIGNISITPTEMGDHRIIRVDVSEGANKPYYWKEKGLREGGVFLRRGSSNIPADESVIFKMIRESPTVPYEDMHSPLQDLTFGDAVRVFGANGLDLGPSQMASLGMVRDGLYTNLGLLLSDQCPQGIKAALFGGDSKRTFQDREEISGSVLRQFELAEGFIGKHNSRRSRIKGAYRIDTRDYPEDAVREVLINALVHRDYAINGSILVEMYPDRLSVSSIGGLNRGLGLDDIMLGTSSRRNEKLAAVMYRLGLMESYGTGIPRLMDAYRDQPSKPTMEVSTNVFRITLPKTIDADLDQLSLKVLGMLSETPMSRSDVEREAGIPRMQALSVLRGLVSADLAEEVGSGRSTAYIRKVRIV